MTNRLQTLFSLSNEIRKSINITNIPYSIYNSDKDNSDKDNENKKKNDILNNLIFVPNFKEMDKVVKKYWGLDWKKYIEEPKCDEYNKIKIPLTDDNDVFDMYLVCWGNKAYAPVHDHSRNGCHMLVLSGDLSEKLYHKSTKDFYKENNLHTKSLSFIDNSEYYHSIKNNSEKNSFSLHIYSPPNFKTQFVEDCKI